MSRKRHKVDEERTKQARFVDYRSYWTLYGSVFLFGTDRSRQRDACFKRDNWTCTKCGEQRNEMLLDSHHVIPLGKHGDDSLANLTTRCKWTNCHRGEHVQTQFGVHTEIVKNTS